MRACCHFPKIRNDWTNIAERGISLPDERLAALTHERYISLTTFRRDGRAVPTVVWFAHDGERILVWTGANSGKVKRIKNNPRVTVAPCDRTGKVTSETWNA